MARKTSSDYFKDYNKATANLSTLESRIENRAKQLAKKQPDIMFEDDVTVAEAIEGLWERDREDRVYTAIDIIRKIEEHNLKQAGIVQKTIYDDLK